MKKLVLAAAIAASTVSFSQMTLHGTATQMGGCDTYQLTPNLLNVAGAAWSSDPIDLTNDFDMIFEVYCGTAGIWGADGMAFVLQQNGTGIGSIGAPLGYGLPYGAPAPSAANLAIELDIWDNTPSVTGEIPQDHIGISSNGGKDHDIFPATQFPGGQEIADGAWHELRIQWVAGFNALAVYWEGSAVPMVSMTYDIPTNIFSGNPIVYWGFTAGTGGISSEFRVRAVGSPSFTTDATTVCPGIPIQFTDGSTTPIGTIASWEWDFGDGSPLNNTQNPSYAYTAPGNYTATLTMSDGFCSYPVSTAITILDSLSLNMSATQVTCFGDTDGTVTGTPTTGVSPYGWSWNPSSQTTETATALAPGMYTVTVTDNDGCVGIDSVEVIEPLQIMLAMDSINVDCNSDSTGSAIVAVTNGAAPITYLWDDFMTQSMDTAGGLPAGMYTVIVTDNDGCTATDSVTINENPAIILSATSTPDNGTNNGTIDLTATGGTGPFSYLWDTAETTEDLSGVATGPHTVTVTDSLGCSEVLVVNVASSIGFLSLADIGFNVYPNPNNGTFTLQGVGEYQIIIRDLRGRTILTQAASETAHIQLQDVESGVYFMAIVKDRAEYIEKLIIK